jgi:K+-sensing histidine kinase KdpD
MSFDNKKIYYLNALLQISLAINDSLELTDVMTQVVFYARSLVRSDQAITLLWNGRRNQFEIGASTEPNLLNLETGGLVEIAKHILNSSTSHQYDNYDSNEDNCHVTGFQSHVGVPIHHAGIGLGVLFALCYESTQFTDSEVDPLNALANMAAIGIRNARLMSSLREINEIKTSIMGVTANDLTTPLNELNSSIHELTETLTNPSQKQLDAWQHINQSIVKMQSQVASLEKYERLTKATNYEPYPCDLNSIVKIVAREFQGATAFKSQRFIITTAEQNLIIYGDHLLLRDAIGTFVNHAIDRSEAGQTIQLGTSICKHHYHVFICDTGNPLSVEEQYYLSHSFVQSEGKTSPVGEGLNFQLAKRIVEQHGGSIDVLMGNGNEVRLLFPKEGIPAIPID